ncbi:DUF4139 domain-containing protein [Aurantiacibacter suaedae]|uniref:DUF4139 domain-containing protein n=1 Tax=Aurantiacibacter suaedae TaxID=2545755 RepID=UPI0010F8B009|nr:hypothetical protein [Aurantiacibacter suaedae]
MTAALVLCLASPANAQDRPTVDASAPTEQAVTIYRDPNRAAGDRLDRDNPQGFAMISEVRTVTLPPGESRIRFTGVAEGMVAVSAIVTGLPGGKIEKNRNADLLSPAALVDGTLGNRVRITRTNPGTGEQASESAIVRTRADGGLVLQTSEGFEPVRCSGLPESLAFDRIPAGLSSEPVFSIDTRDASGGTYTVTLSYLAWGFDWEANYVATLAEAGARDKARLRLVSWLTLLNDNGQSFENADLMAVAGTINVESDFEGLAEPPRARPLRLTCYPIGSTAEGSPERRVRYAPPSSPAVLPSPVMARMVSAEAVADEVITVTGSRLATEEDLGDLKLYRVPEQVTVAAKSLKQIAFLDRPEVEGRIVYRADQCVPWTPFPSRDNAADFTPATLMLITKNDEEHGLGAALPLGNMALFEPSPAGDLLVNELNLRDYAVGQDVELDIGQSPQVFTQCARLGAAEPDSYGERWMPMRARVTNANPHSVTMRIMLGQEPGWNYRFARERLQTKNGVRYVEVKIPANSTTDFDWQMRSTLR